MKKLLKKDILKKERRLKHRLQKECDRTWYIKYLKKTCEVCGSLGVLQGHHYYYKGSSPALRHVAENHITLCRGCHFLLHHQDPKKIEEKILKARGKKWLDKLNKIRKERSGWRSFETVKFYQVIIKELNL